MRDRKNQKELRILGKSTGIAYGCQSRFRESMKELSLIT